MRKKDLGIKLIRISGIACILISILAIVFLLIDGKWSGLFHIGRIALHICLFVMGYWSWHISDTQCSIMLVGGIAGMLLSGYMFISHMLSFLYTPTVWGIMYMLSLPATIMFFCGVVLRGKQ